MRMRNLVSLLVALVLVLAACASTGEEEATTTTVDPKADWPETVVYGFVPSGQAEELVDSIQPYMDYLSEELGIEFDGRVTPDYNGLVVAMGSGQADFGAFGPFGYVQAQTQYPTIEAIIQSVRFGSGTYHGQWFTNDPTICETGPAVGALENKDGEIVTVEPFDAVALQVGVGFDDDGNKVQETLEDGTQVDFGQVCGASLEAVAGKSIAFTEATSTSGALFPQLQLLNVGIDIENDITYSYVGSHDNAISAVYNGDFDIGLSYDDARRTLRKDQPDVGSKLTVFNITDEIPNDVVAARGELPDSLKLAVYEATAAFLETDEGKAIFDEIYGWTSIRPAVESDFEVVREAAVKLGVTSD